MQTVENLKNSINTLTSEYKIGTTTQDFEKLCNLVLPSQIRVVIVAGDALNVECISEGVATKISSLPNNLVGFVSFSAESTSALEEISKHWELHGRKFGPACIQIENQQDTATLHSWLIDQIISSNIQTATRNVTLMRELTQIRSAHEESQRAFYNLERYVEANLELRRNLATTIEPCSQFIELSQKKNRVTQLLPTVSVGVSDIGIHVSSSPKDKNGLLKASLYAIESGRNVGSWIVPAASLGKNWVQLSLVKTLGVDEESLSISLEWVGTDSISISLGSAHPDEKWCANALGSIANRTLAVKVWRSLPDTAPTLSPRSFTDIQGASKNWLVDNDSLKSADSNSANKDFVKYIDDLGAILVHPESNTPMIARLRKCAIKGAKHISAIIESGRQDATLIEYAIAVATPKAADDNSIASDFKPGFISEWMALAGGSKSQIHLFLPTPLENTGDVYLITRIRQGNSNENCWAYFKKIQITA